MKIIKTLPLLLGALLLLGSCVKEELSGENSVVEGKETLLKLSLNASFQNEAPLTRATLPEGEEKKFKDIRVMVFKPTGEIVTNSKTIYPVATDKPDLIIKTYSGNNRTVYVIANVVDEVDAKLSTVQNQAQLNKIQTTAVEFANGLSGKPLAMIGSKTLTIEPRESNSFTMQMEFMVVKLSLTVIDATPPDQTVTILGWDIENAPQNSFLILNGGDLTQKDANDDLPDDDKLWLSTNGGLFPFETDPKDSKIANLTQYVFENRRGGRNKAQNIVPPYKLDGGDSGNINDGNHKGKAWYAPDRATCIVVHAMHKSPAGNKSIEARIFFGNDNNSDYNIIRGRSYNFTVTVKGLNDIDIDTNLKPTNANFAVHTSAPLEMMDAHPDFRPMMISGDDGVATIEVLDATGLTHDQPGFAATWVKVSPLNLMYHQVKQAGAAGDWQQMGAVGTFVRAKYIPHRSVRATLLGKGGWNAIPAGKEDDDVMTLSDATHRMCYKITDIKFGEGKVANKSLCIYTDDYPIKDGKRSAQIKVVFQPNGFKPDGVTFKEPEIRILNITQTGYLSFFDTSIPDAGLEVIDENGKISGISRMFGIEQYEEVGMQMNPGISPEVQMTTTMQWGHKPGILYNKGDQFRNGYFMTANAVYTDVGRSTDNMPIDFGISSTSYRPMYGNGKIEATKSIIPNYGNGTHSDSPYYYPTATNLIYHPIFKSSAARYCHEKNRDINGDGFIDTSETKWYLPSYNELLMLWVAGIKLSDDRYVSMTEGYSYPNSINGVFYVSFTMGVSSNASYSIAYRVRCLRII